MKRNCIIGLIVLLVGASVAIFLASREPEYGGRTLSSWLGDLDYGIPGFDHTKFAKAEEAVRQIGPRAVPGLISMMRYEESSFSARIRKLFAKQKLIKIKPPLSAEHFQWRGARGVWILGPSAKATIPHLITLLTNQSSWVRGGAAMALGKTINPHEMLIVPEAIRLIEEELGEQGNLVLSPSTNGVILVNFKQNGRR